VPDDKTGRRIEEEPLQDVPPPQPINTPVPPDSPPTPPAQAIPDNNVTGTVKNIEDSVKRAERWMIGLTAGIVLLTLGLVIVGVLQWRVMSGQLGEMRSSSGQTDQLIAKTGTLASNAGTQADRTKDLADRMKDQAEWTRNLVEQARRSADSAGAVQRPWMRLSLSLAHFTPIEHGYDLTMIPHLRNSGSGVGTKVSLRIEFRIPPTPITNTVVPGERNLFVVADEYQQWCETVKPDVRGLRTYFPGDNRDEPQWTVNVLDSDMMKSQMTVKGETRFTVLVYGCVLYKFEPFTEWHHTGVVYELDGVGDGGIPLFLFPKKT